MAANASNNATPVPAAAGGAPADETPVIAPPPRWPEDLNEAAQKALDTAEGTRKRLEELRREAAQLYEQHQHELSIAKSLKAARLATPAAPAESPAPSEQKRKKNEPLSAQVKALIAKNILEDGKSWKEILQTFDVSRSTVAAIVKAEKTKRSGGGGQNDGSNSPPHKRGRKTVFTPETLVFLCEQVEHDATVTLADLKKKLAEDFHVDVVLATISKTLAKLKLTWKALLPIPASWNSQRTLDLRIEFVTKATVAFTMHNKEFIFVDEQGYNLHMRKSKGRALAGHKAVITLKPKGNRISVIAALSPSRGVISTKLVESLGPRKRGTNADDFRLFIHDLRPQLRGKVLVLDNAKIHHAERIEDMWPQLQAEGVEVLFLPPYSPFLNAIEYAFNKMKTIVIAAHPDNPRTLKDVIDAAAKAITPADAAAFEKKARSYWEHAQLGLPYSGTPLEPLATPPPLEGAYNADADVATDDE